MRGLIDSIFLPFIGWLNDIYNWILQLSVPVSRGLNIGDYLGPLSYFGMWSTVITTLIFMLFVYVLLFIIFNNIDTLIRFKDMIKWW